MPRETAHSLIRRPAPPRLWVVVPATLLLLGAASAPRAWAQGEPAAENLNLDDSAAQAGFGATTATPPAESYAADPAQPGTTLIPPHVEGNAYPATAGGYCYVGPHPADTRVTQGAHWDETQGQHLHQYSPVDLRLFSYRDGCYYFIGDPRDFGYSGRTYSYYGAHPVLDVYGGGWCFMMGGHAHGWAPWSTHFTVVGPWYYWHGPYDPFFWSYWPYYSFYYRSYYPHYYGGGRFYRGGGWQPPPPIRSVPAAAWRPPGRGGAGLPPAVAPAARGVPAVRGGVPPTSAAGVTPPWRGAPGQGWQGSHPAPVQPWRGAPTTPAPAWRPPASTGSVPHGVPHGLPHGTWGNGAPAQSAPRSFSPPSGGFRGGSGFSPPRSFSPPSGGFRGGGGFSPPRSFSPPSGGFRGGGAIRGGGGRR
jgi:hypothetical protein